MKRFFFLLLLPLVAGPTAVVADDPTVFYSANGHKTPLAEEYKVNCAAWCSRPEANLCVHSDPEITPRYPWKKFGSKWYKSRTTGVQCLCSQCGHNNKVGGVRKMRMHVRKCASTNDYPQGWTHDEPEWGGQPNGECPSPRWWDTDLACVDSNWDSYNPDDFDVTAMDADGTFLVGYPVDVPPHCQNKGGSRYKRVGCFAIWGSDTLTPGLRNVTVDVPGTGSKTGLSVSMSITMVDPSTAYCNSVEDFSRPDYYTATREYIDKTGRPVSDPPDYIDQDGTQNWDNGGGYQYSYYKWNDHNPQPWPIEEPGDPGI